MLPLGVLVSGSGTNLQAILDACAAGRVDAKVSVVISNVAGVKALERAKDFGVPAAVVDHKAFADRPAFESRLVEVLRGHGVELVCLAGFMRLLTRTFLSAFPQRVINVHPALLPSFPGVHGARQALEYGVKVTGCSVHFVDEGTDSGPVIAQAAVPVLDTDDEAALQARIQVQEHRLYVAVVDLIARGRVRVEGRRVRIDAPVDGTAALVNPALGRG